MQNWPPNLETMKTFPSRYFKAHIAYFIFFLDYLESILIYAYFTILVSFLYTIQPIIHTTEVQGSDDPQEGRQEEETQEESSRLPPADDEAEDPDRIVSINFINIRGNGRKLMSIYLGN